MSPVKSSKRVRAQSWTTITVKALCTTFLSSYVHYYEQQQQKKKKDRDQHRMQKSKQCVYILKTLLKMFTDRSVVIYILRYYVQLQYYVFLSCNRC